MAGCLTSRNDSYDLSAFAITMTNNQNCQFRAQPKKKELVFFIRMVRVMYQQGTFVNKYCLRFSEGYAVFLYI